MTEEIDFLIDPKFEAEILADEIARTEAKLKALGAAEEPEAAEEGEAAPTVSGSRERALAGTAFRDIANYSLTLSAYRVMSGSALRWPLSVMVCTSMGRKGERRA